MNNYNNIAFIPVRGGSKSIPLKNIQIINGRPLIYWVLDAAVGCSYIDKVIVSTDSEKIKSVVENYHHEKVQVINRSPETATDTASTEMAMLECAEKTMFKHMVLIQATSPLLKAESLEEGFNKLFNEEKDSVLSVVRQKRFVWKERNGEVTAVNYDYYNRPRRQEFDGFLVENGAFYITSRENLLKSKCRISGSIGLVEMPEETYFEIDEPSDWIIIERLLKVHKTTQSKKKIKMLLTDSDGVLTDGGMYYSEHGDELKKFNTKDGMGFELLRQKGIITGIITGESRELVKNRAQKLKIDELYMGVKNKLQVVNELCNKYKISLEEVAYIGDDINDEQVINSVGLGCCVQDSIHRLKEGATYITKCKGGEGAVREVVEKIIEMNAE